MLIIKIYTVLSNKQHPEYGVASIPFSIESDAFEHAIGLLEPLEIGKVKRLEDTDMDLMYSDLLPPDEYELLILVAVHGYTMREAAAEFGINVEVCKKRIQRAKKKLKKLLEEK